MPRRALVAVLFALLALVVGAPAASAKAPKAPTGLKAFLLRVNEPDALYARNFPRTPAFAWKAVKGAKRYDFEVSTSECGCGAQYLKMEDVPGRQEDIFEYEHGVRVHPITFDSVLGKEPSVHEYRVRQTEQGARVELISRSTVDVERLRKALETCLVSSGLTEPQIELLRVDSLRGQESGKLKRFVSLSRVRMTEVAQH